MNVFVVGGHSSGIVLEIVLGFMACDGCKDSAGTVGTDRSNVCNMSGSYRCGILFMELLFDDSVKEDPPGVCKMSNHSFFVLCSRTW